MSPAPIFHGTILERTELLAALTRNCTCTTGPMGMAAVVQRCAGHTAMLESQSFVDHLEFARTLRRQLWAEEFLCPEAPP